MSNDRWATVSSREFPATGQYRHIVRRGGVTSACGTTGLPATVWRLNRTKPECPSCVAAVQRLQPAHCARCGAEGHDARACTPAPCPSCGGVESHASERCPVWRQVAGQ